MRGRSWAVGGLIAVLVFNVWWRCHTVGPAIKELTGVNLYPVTGTASEPLDCDEAVYSYIGQRITRGAVMYVDMTENKPPGGYWAFAIAALLGADSELGVRLMPVPLVLSTIILVWWIALRLRGPGAAVVAALTYAVVSADPFLFGNGANMEHLINLAAVGGLALTIDFWTRSKRWQLLAAGACIGLAALVKQVAILHAAVFGLALLLRKGNPQEPGEADPPLRSRILDLLAFSGGIVAVGAIALALLLAQGASRAAYEDIVVYAAASATDIPSDPNAPAFLVRWFTGNADPTGRLPWPFGQTGYLVWWGTASWPLWLTAIPALAWLLLSRNATGPGRLVAFWTLSAWVQVALPRHFWQHYYLLPVPGLAIAVAVWLGALVGRARAKGRWRWAAGFAAATVVAALAVTAFLQVKEYLLVPPMELTIRDKGGRQWVSLRDLGTHLGWRTRTIRSRSLFVWGWQSPLFFYSRLRPVTPQLFTDDLIRAHAGKEHRVIKPRVDRMMADLKREPPTLIFAGYEPFPALRLFLRDRYLPSTLLPPTPDGRGLWVLEDVYATFENAHESFIPVVRGLPTAAPRPADSGPEATP